MKNLCVQNRKKYVIFSQSLVILILSCSTLNSFGCSCELISFESATEWADEIFIGRIVETKEILRYTEANEAINTRVWVARFEVEKKWKGSSNKIVEVFQGSTSCDFNFEFPGPSYIVYSKEEDVLSWDSTQTFIGQNTWLCARNADEYTYKGARENSFDDRELLDQKYPNTIKISSKFKHWFELLLGMLILVFGILIGRFTKKLST